MNRKTLTQAVTANMVGDGLRDLAVGACSACLKTSEHLLQWLEQAQLTELQTIHDWTEAVHTAADRAAHAKSLDELMTAQGDLFAAGLTQAANGRGSLLISWVELQAALPEDVQRQTADAIRSMSLSHGDEAPAGWMPTWPMAALYEQARSAFSAMAGPWMAALQPSPWPGIAKPPRSE
jgi:hypothetical protein